MPMFSVAPRQASPEPSVAPAADRAADPASDGSADSAHTAPAASVPGAGSFDVGRPESAPVPANAGPNPDFPNNAAPGAPVPGRTDVRGPAESEIVDRPSALVEVPSNAPLLPARQAPTAGLALARANDGLPMVLDPFAVASRAVLVLIGSVEPAKHIARTAIEMSIEHDSSAAIDVVIPRAIDLVLRRAAHLVSIGAGPKVVDHYTRCDRAHPRPVPDPDRGIDAPGLVGRGGGVHRRLVCRHRPRRQPPAKHRACARTGDRPARLGPEPGDPGTLPGAFGAVRHAPTVPPPIGLGTIPDPPSLTTAHLGGADAGRVRTGGIPRTPRHTDREVSPCSATAAPLLGPTRRRSSSKP